MTFRSTTTFRRRFHSLRKRSRSRQAADSASPEQISAIERALRKNRAAIDDPAEFVRTNIDFHFQIAHASENMFVDALHVALNQWLEEHRKIAIRKAGAARLALRRHEEIFEAIRRHDRDAAETAMRTHLSESRDAYWTVVDAPGGGTTPPEGDGSAEPPSAVGA